MAGTNLYGETSAEIRQFYSDIGNAVFGERQDAANHRAIMDAHAEAQTAYGYFNELMERYNQLREAYIKLDATCDAAFDIIRENEEKIGITKDEVNQRIREYRNRAVQNAAAEATGN
ncbi:MAG: hypothetical protein LBB66_08160 [Desulfovibrio sp.]|jgi:hypothetical protein|nr:hypothetical protein [Desulfovibrio sp.]